MTSRQSATPATNPTRSGLKQPRAGDVIHYRYLWRHEAARRVEDGAKPRPCLVLATQQTAGGLVVYTCPISSKNIDPPHSIEIPSSTRRVLGLSKRSWVVWNDLNRFTWVGPDMQAKADGEFYYGNVGERLWQTVRQHVISAAVGSTNRTI